jgi:hypothetical protein
MSVLGTFESASKRIEKRQYSSGFGMNSVTRIAAGVEPVADVESERRQEFITDGSH